MDHQSNMQKHMIRNSYRMHKQRLSSIKQNNTSLQFYTSNKAKPQDRKKIMMLQKRREEIQHQNNILQEKINKIKHRQSKDQQAKQLDQNKKDKHLIHQRYAEQNQEDFNPIEVNSNYGDDLIKCVIPAPYPIKKKYYSQPKRLKALNHTTSGLKQQLQTHKQFNQNKITLQIRKSLFKKDKEQDSILHPEQDIDRVVIYKKTSIIGVMTSCLTEISIIGKRILLTTYVMGTENHTSTLFLDQQKSNQLILAYSDNFQALGSKISLDANWQIKLGIIWNDDKKLDLLDNSRKVKQPITKQEKYASQQDFIKRNYYVKHKRQQENQSAEPSNVKSSINKPKTSRQGKEVNPLLRRFGITPSYNSSKDIKETMVKNIQPNKRSVPPLNSFTFEKQQDKKAAQKKNNGNNEKISKNYEQQNYEQVQQFNGSQQNQYVENQFEQIDKKVDSESLKNISQVRKKEPSYEQEYQQVFQDNQSSMKNESQINKSSVNNQSSLKNNSITKNQINKFAKKKSIQEEQQYGQDFENKQKVEENNYQEEYQQQYNEQVENAENVENYEEDFA